MSNKIISIKNSKRSKILISACLIGEKVKYNGLDNALISEKIERWSQENRLLPICPEIEGGLTVPRNPVEIQAGEGVDVLSGKAKAMDSQGRNVTKEFIDGAESTLELARKHNVKVAILKERSPSCGSSIIYNGQFNGTCIKGMGVTARLLSENNIRVFSEEKLDEVEELINTQEM